MSFDEIWRGLNVDDRYTISRGIVCRWVCTCVCMGGGGGRCVCVGRCVGVCVVCVCVSCLG